MISKLREEIEEKLKKKNIFLVTDKGVIKAGLLDKVLFQINVNHIFDEVEENPKHETINRAGEIVRRIKPELIIGLGGGSAMDAAKAIALLATNPGRVEDYEGREKYSSPPLPVLAIPTTCGTGSEVTWVSVITHTGRKFKMSIKGPELFPLVAVVDPDLLLTLPQKLIASTGLDALTHSIEAFTVRQATPFTDIFAREAFSLIITSIEDAWKDIRKNSEARSKIMLGSTLAGIAFCASDVGSVHCLSEALGSLYDIPHGVANSLFLPFVMEFNLPFAKSRYAQLGWLAGIKAQDEEESSKVLIQRIKDLSQNLGIPTLRELGIKRECFLEIAKKAFENNSNSSNPREADIEDYVKILERALN